MTLRSLGERLGLVQRAPKSKTPRKRSPFKALAFDSLEDRMLLSVPSLSINDVSVTEGNSGNTTAAFKVTLSSMSMTPVTVQYSTADGTATAVSDYTATSGTLYISPGMLSQVVSVTVLGDTLAETDETFYVNLSSSTNATIARGQGVGTILNDARLPRCRSAMRR